MNKKTIKLISLTVLLVVAAIAVAVSIPIINFLSQENANELISSYINSLGFGGVLVFGGIQLLQVVIAIIPGEPVEFAAGILYGWFWGVLICIFFTALGSIIVFSLMKKLGEQFALNFFSKESLDKFKFLKNEQSLELIIFALFFVPGTPKDLLTYIAPLTGIKLWRFIAITSVARIPSIVTSTLAGATLGEGNIMTTILIFAVTGVIGIVGVFAVNRYLKRKNG